MTQRHCRYDHYRHDGDFMRVYWPPSVWVVVSEQSVGWLGGTHYVCEEHLDDILVAVDDVGLLEFYQYHPPKES